MKKLAIGTFVLGAGLVFGGCLNSSPKTPAGNSTGYSETTASPAVGATDKVGVTKKTGKVVKLGSTYGLQVGSQTIGIDTYNLDLSQYVGKQVTVSGQYSGDTLFVTEIQ